MNFVASYVEGVQFGSQRTFMESNALLKYRTNRVITDLDLTEEYNMKNGIDQGETMLPLLWVIYYDPVFSKIKKQKGIGYIMNLNLNF